MGRLRLAAARGSQLLDDLTSFVSITSENEPSTVFNLSDLVQNVISELQDVIDKTQGEIKSSGLPEIYGNPKYIHLLFQHLISNALKFCKNEPHPG
jgi:light-regulated signal transduction histidine kinase (bacteriophytochrome)